MDRKIDRTYLDSARVEYISREADSRRVRIRESYSHTRQAGLFLSLLGFRDGKIYGNEASIETAMNHLIHAALILRGIIEESKKKPSHASKACRASSFNLKVKRDGDLASVLSIMGRIKRKKILEAVNKGASHDHA